MPAYVLVQVRVHDPAGYEEYRRLSTAAAAAYGGRFIVRGGQTEVLEGDWDPGRLVVLEFPSAEDARRWWSSPAYEEAKRIRHDTAATQMILVAGVAP